ncbi:MAG: 4-hydroxy-tetrahydrodipicolinate reductase [Parachlamydiaceae bacterium]
MKKKRRKKVSPKNSLFFLLFCLLITLYTSWISELETASVLPTSKEPAIFYANSLGDHLRKTIEAAITNAQKSITLMIYSLSDPDIINALRKKSEEGIHVTVIYDAKASVNVHRKLGPKVNAIARAADGLMHQKMLTIDEENVWLGSANYTTDSLMEQGNLITAFYCKHLAKAILKKAACMSEENYEGTVPSCQHLIIGEQPCELWFLPDDKKAAIRIKELIRSASKTIEVAMFAFTRLDFANELISAQERGVQVSVFLDHQSSKGASKKVAEMLAKQGIAIYTNPGKSLHHYKLLLVDNEVLVNGSANWTKAAFKQNDDFFMIIHQLNEQQKQKMTDLTNHLKSSMTPLRLALLGNGKMGKLIAKAAEDKGHLLSPLQKAQVAIDFSHPSVVLNNVEKAASLGKPIVMGTTGWEADEDAIRKIVDHYQIGFLYSPNFSIGVHLFLKALKEAAHLIASQGGYDVGGFEIHHREKADSPSGTAKAITTTLLSSFKEKKNGYFEKANGMISKDHLHFSSLRLGENPGTHSVIFDSPYDTITLTHAAKNRQGFAMGAIQAAEWLNGKTGFYTLEDIL